jgi:hypothetical protein
MPRLITAVLLVFDCVPLIAEIDRLPGEGHGFLGVRLLLDETANDQLRPPQP